ncbi:hypothetical protein RJ639_034385 [Escallonia herrerae]|uniref:Reverse transcriptase Ty1/copia-type domain-containing protein n=1 Tax=Escallonia herrerae TaxID=1293975 RepID=A0AA89BAQ2_9ASTE|nr:hypothetical protein RJ639_034385 [Escallonia herrerae]
MFVGFVMHYMVSKKLLVLGLPNSVNDMFITGNDLDDISVLKQDLYHPFELKDCTLSYCHGCEVSTTSDRYYLSQAKYASDLLSRAGLTDSNTIYTPHEPNVQFTPLDGTPLLDPTLYHTLVDTHSSLELHAYSDADWAGDPTNQCSTTDSYFFLGTYLISQRSKKQALTARSSTETEYRALADTTQKLLWLRCLLEDMRVTHSTATPLYCDNRSAIEIARNYVLHERTKYIEIDCHFVH